MSQAMTESQLDELKRLLATRKDELNAQMQKNLSNLAPAENTAGSVSQDEAARLSNQTREVDWALTDMDRAELRRIERAFELMNDGIYGLCGECGQQIPFERLRIEPMTQHCVACKSQWEKRLTRV